MPFEPINIRDIENPVKRIADDWALLSAGTPENWNTMTVSWGGVGEIWGFDAAFVFVRPQRHTMKFMDECDYFTLSFGLSRAATVLCGKASGRDFPEPCGKIAAAGLTTHAEGGAVWPEEAEFVIVCRKAAKQNLDPVGFLDPGIEENYPGKDYHSMFVGEITGAWRSTAA